MSPVRRRAAHATFAAAALVAATLTAAPAGAVDEPPRPPFYEAPAALPDHDGDVIRSERLAYLLDPLDASSLVKDSTRVLYRTTDRTGEPIATSGTVLLPRAPWSGPGDRPVIGYAAGTQGVADRCAPSRQFSEGLEYEGIGIEALLARGYAVAMTDYEGLGTEGVHTYMDRVSQGHAVLDAVRAAQRLPGTGLSASSPVGLQGYSQGGGAAAAAAELAASYAPELDVRGAVVGAVPADLAAVAENLDGGPYAAFAFFALRGLAASYDFDPTPYLNAEGVATMEQVEQDCVFDLFGHAFKRSEDLSADGRPMSELLVEEPFASMVGDQLIGRIAPAVPVLVTHSRLDDVIPFAVGKQMATSWCDRGATVRFAPNLDPGHVGGMASHLAQAPLFWEARFNSVAPVSSCWRL